MTTANEIEPGCPLLLARGRTVLVPLDGSEMAASAWPVARILAELHEAALKAVYLAPERIEPRALPGLVGIEEAELRGAIIDQATGAPESVVVRKARERACGLVVVSTHFEARREAPAPGPFLRRILTGCFCPLVFIPRGFVAKDWKLQSILLPQDGTPTMAFSIAPAMSLALRASATLYVLHVAGEPPSKRAEPGSFHVPRYVDQAQHEWPAWTREFLSRVERLGRAPSGLDLRMHLAHGQAGDTIVRFAKEHEVSLIVLAFRGRLNHDRALTLRTVLSRAPCPVLVLRSS